MQYLYGEDARYPDGTADSFQTQRGHVGVVAVLQTHAESSQEWRPRQLRNEDNYSIIFMSMDPARCRAGVTLNMGLTCSRCVALVKGAWTWLTASIRALAVLAICSISTLYSRRLCFSLATPAQQSHANPSNAPQQREHHLNYIFETHFACWTSWSAL